MTCDTSGVKRARTTHKAQPPLVPEKPVESQNEKPAPLETPPGFGVADPLSPPAERHRPPPPRRSRTSSLAAATVLAGAVAAATVPESVGKPEKEKRGKRYTSLQSVRKGLARVENDLAAGKLDSKTAAVRVQALQAIANVLALAEGAKLNREAAEMNARASALVKTGGARA